MSNNSDMASMACRGLSARAVVTRDDVLAAVQALAPIAQLQGWTWNADDVVRLVEEQLIIYAPPPIVLADPTDHVDWFFPKKESMKFDFWRRYERYLETQKSMPPRVVRALDLQTDRILDKLEDPVRPGPWDCRGMVVGQVQSGKTGNYSGLLCKAADAGYRLIVVLAGLNNDLRAQTQQRLDETFAGFDSRRNDGNRANNLRVGVGVVPGKHPDATVLTNASDGGDFNAAFAGQAMVSFQTPVLVVIKKHARILDNLRRWIDDIRGVDGGGHRVVKDLPLLVIDDEADNATVNTARDQDGITAINGAIRRLLNLFEKTAYVAYTATPFANIYIDRGASDDAAGEDLFPRSFIVNLEAPTNYFGPRRVFGIAPDQDAELGATEPLPLVRSVDDETAWIASPHRATWKPGPLPSSLKTSVESFLLACAARKLRGHVKQHNSMLIHVTRYNDVQHAVYLQIKSYVEELVHGLSFDIGGTNPVADSMETLWKGDFTNTSRQMDAPLHEWKDIRAVLPTIAGRFKVKEVNGSAGDTLDYWDHPDGIDVIAVGGDKLSRGLTLDGLSVSYYLRASQMYDTLMQMGRWFGYRPGYEDLCRLFTTPQVRTWFQQVTLASEELRRDFDVMASTPGATPNTFGLKVRAFSGGLTVTAASKMRRGTRLKLSYSADSAETVVLKSGVDDVVANFQAADTLVSALGAVTKIDPQVGSRVWRVDEPELVLDFLDAYRTHPHSPRANTRLLARYVRLALEKGELRKWWIKLVGIEKGSTPVVFNGLPHNPVNRAPLGTNVDGGASWSMRRLINPADESTGLAPDALDRALKKTKENSPAARRPSGRWVREQRSADEGLLLLYPLDIGLGAVATGMTKEIGDALSLSRDVDPRACFVGMAFSFPKSAQHVEVEYVANDVFVEDLNAEEDEVADGDG